MLTNLFKFIDESKHTAFAQELYKAFSTKEVEKEVIHCRIRHLMGVGYNKSQITLSISNEFNKSERSTYRYIAEVEYGENR